MRPTHSRGFFFAPEHGGSTVKSGRPQSDPEAKTTEEVSEALGQAVTGHGKTPGTNDPGVPGSRTNPVRDQEPKPEDEKLGRGPTGVGTAAGS